MLDRVDFLTPRPGRFVAAVQVEFFVQQQRGEQVGLRVPDQVLHDALGLGVGGLTEIRTEPVVQREPNVLTCRDHTVSDDPTLQATHPVGQHDLGCPTQLGEALTQHSQRGGGLLIGGEPYEPPPRPRQYRTEHVYPALGAPVDDQMLTRGPDGRSAPPVVLDPPVLLGRRDQPAKVSGRPGIPGSACRGQQPLGRDPPVRLLYPLDHKVGDDLIVAGPLLGRRSGTSGSSSFNHPFDSLVRRPTDRGGATVSTRVLISGNDGHSVPRRLQWSSPGRCGDWLDTATVTVQGSNSGSTRRARGGDFHLATSGDLQMATRGDFLMARDSPCGHGVV